MQSPLPQLPTGSGEVPDRAFYLRESSTRRGIPTNVSNGCPVDGCKEFLKTCDWPALSRLVVTIALIIVVVRVPPRSVSTDLRKSGGTPSGNHSAKRYMSSPAGTRGRIVDRGFSKAIASFSSPLPPIYILRGGNFREDKWWRALRAKESDILLFFVLSRHSIFLRRIVYYQTVDPAGKYQSDAGLQRIDETPWIIKSSVSCSSNTLFLFAISVYVWEYYLSNKLN